MSAIYVRAALAYIRQTSPSLTRSEGQALIEYALIVSLVALVAIASLTLAGTNISSILHRIAGEV